MDFLKKTLMVLGVLWIIGFVTTLALGFGLYSMVSSSPSQLSPEELQRQDTLIEARRHNEMLNREATSDSVPYGEVSEENIP